MESIYSERNFSYPWCLCSFYFVFPTYKQDLLMLLLKQFLNLSTVLNLLYYYCSPRQSWIFGFLESFLTCLSTSIMHPLPYILYRVKRGILNIYKSITPYKKIIFNYIFKKCLDSLAFFTITCAVQCIYLHLLKFSPDFPWHIYWTYSSASLVQVIDFILIAFVASVPTAYNDISSVSYSWITLLAGQSNIKSHLPIIIYVSPQVLYRFQIL